MNRTNQIKVVGISIVMLGMTACSSNPKYACPATKGLGCVSVKQVYNKYHSGTLKTTRDIRVKSKSPKPDHSVPGQPEGTLVSAQAPMYVAPKVMRIWIGPWVDKHGVYHSQSYVYKVVSKGKWMNQPGVKPGMATPATFYSSLNAK